MKRAVAITALTGLALGFHWGCGDDAADAAIADCVELCHRIPECFPDDSDLAVDEESGSCEEECDGVISDFEDPCLEPYQELTQCHLALTCEELGDADGADACQQKQDALDECL